MQKYAEKYLQDLINVEKVIVWFCDNAIGKMFRFDGSIDNVTRLSNELGILGLCSTGGEKHVVLDPSNNNHYNQNVDINTELPLVTMPIKDSTDFAVNFFLVKKLDHWSLADCPYEIVLLSR